MEISGQRFRRLQRPADRLGCTGRAGAVWSGLPVARRWRRAVERCYSAFFRACAIGGETRSVLLSIQSKPENVMEAKIVPRSPHRRGRQTKQAKARQARRLGSWSVLPDDVGGWPRSAVLGGADALPEQPHPILLLRANHLGFRAKNSETERVTLAMGERGGAR